MRPSCPVIAAAITVALLSVAPAEESLTDQTPAPPQVEAQKDGAGRFSLTRVDGGFLRLDSVSGRVSFCSQRAVGWVCQSVPEDRAALDAEIERLQGEVASLKAEIAGSVPPRPPADISSQAGQGSGKDATGLKFPSRAEVERARAAIERAWRHLVDTISEFHKDIMRKG